MSYYPDIVDADWPWFKNVFGKNGDDKEHVKSMMIFLAKVRNPLKHENENYLSDKDRSNTVNFGSELIKQIDDFLNNH